MSFYDPYKDLNLSTLSSNSRGPLKSSTNFEISNISGPVHLQNPNSSPFSNLQRNGRDLQRSRDEPRLGGGGGNGRSRSARAMLQGGERERERERDLRKRQVEGIRVEREKGIMEMEMEGLRRREEEFREREKIRREEKDRLRDKENINCRLDLSLVCVIQSRD
jgi:hypothetical protein